MDNLSIATPVYPVYNKNSTGVWNKFLYLTILEYSSLANKIKINDFIDEELKKYSAVWDTKHAKITFANQEERTRFILTYG